jgi:hypothetical protein
MTHETYAGNGADRKARLLLRFVDRGLVGGAIASYRAAIR